MKALFIMLAAVLVSQTSFATVDVQSSVYIVVENIQEEGSYMVQKAPAEYCVGIPALALAEAITKPVVISKGYSCGSDGVMENTNAASCVVINANEVWEGETLKYNQVRLSTNLDNCGEKKSDAAFVKAVNKAIEMTYKANKIEIVP